MPSFFETYRVHFDPWATGAPAKGLRNCQLGAYWAVWSHFTSTTKPALVSLPTGAGKTALMMALAFGLKASRVLIITPAATLRDQTAEKFRDLDDLKTTGVMDGTVPSPKVLSNAQQLDSRKAWLELQSIDVVVATPKTTINFTETCTSSGTGRSLTPPTSSPTPLQETISRAPQ